MRSEDIAWAAGLFEGEGTVVAARQLAGQAPPQPQAKLAMATADAVHRFHAILGLGYLHWEIRQPPHSSLRVWRCWGRENVETVLALLGDNLSERRKAQFESALADATPAGFNWHQRREYAAAWRAREGVI